MYKLVDYDQEPIQGTFYQSELQRVSKRDAFKVDKILKRRRRKGVSEVFVSWLGYPKKFNSWIKETDLQDLSKGSIWFLSNHCIVNRHGQNFVLSLSQKLFKI